MFDLLKVGRNIARLRGEMGILEEGKATRILASVLDHTTEEYLLHHEVSVKEISELAPILGMEQVGEVFEHVKESAEIADLLSLAPFISVEVMEKCAPEAFFQMTHANGSKYKSPF